MKRLGTVLLSVFLMGLFVSIVHAQEWFITNQATITWDAVTELHDGTVIPEVDIIEYRIWLSNANIDPDKANPIEVGTTSELVYVVTLNTEGRFFVGLQTIRKTLMGLAAEERVVGESEVGWSDNPAIVKDGLIFGLQYFLPPAVPCGVTLL